MQIVVFKSSKNKSISYKLNGYLFIFIIIASIIALSYLENKEFQITGHHATFKLTSGLTYC